MCLWIMDIQRARVYLKIGGGDVERSCRWTGYMQQFVRFSVDLGCQFLAGYRRNIFNIFLL